MTNAGYLADPAWPIWLKQQFVLIPFFISKLLFIWICICHYNNYLDVSVGALSSLVYITKKQGPQHLRPLVIWEYIKSALKTKVIRIHSLLAKQIWFGRSKSLGQGHDHKLNQKWQTHHKQINIQIKVISISLTSAKLLCLWGHCSEKDFVTSFLCKLRIH